MWVFFGMPIFRSSKVVSALPTRVSSTASDALMPRRVSFRFGVVIPPMSSVTSLPRH